MSKTNQTDASSQNKQPRMSEKELKKQARKEHERAMKQHKETEAQIADHPKEKNKDKTLASIKDEIKGKTKEAKEAKESHYRFPDDCISPADKKTFRRKARAAKESFLSQITKLQLSGTKGDKTKLKQVEEEYKEWQTKTYTTIPAPTAN